MSGWSTGRQHGPSSFRLAAIRSTGRDRRHPHRGTSDIPVAEEARLIAEEMGCEVRTAYDVGCGDPPPLLALGDLIAADVFIVAAGVKGRSRDRRGTGRPPVIVFP
jgi:hypothetical protein